MATQQSANVYVTNETDGTAFIKLFHQNESDGIQNASWTVPPGATAGPMAVLFETGWDSWGILDWWSVIVAVADGAAPGTYQNSGPDIFPHWKECQLQGGDAGQNLTFSVSTAGFGINLASGRCTDSMTRLADFSKITNVFVLMLENHSFDNTFGQSGIPGISHATPQDSNSHAGASYFVGSPAPKAMPTDPGHEFQDVVKQLAGEDETYPHGGPYPGIKLSGFAANYATSTTEGPAPAKADVGKIMLGFDTSSQLCVIYELATEFALCDHWFSSLPGPTWPNRFFVHGASSSGLDHSPTRAQMLQWETVWPGFTYPNGSIYDALSGAGLTWSIYRDDTNAYSDDPQNGSVFGAIPQVSAIKGIRLSDTRSLTRFAADLQSPYAYQYTFIEPNYGDITSTYRGGSSQHPMDDVYGGEGLIKAVYDQWGFPFNQYGARVPAVAISPWIPAQTVDTTVYDHASVPATVERLFGLAALTARDAGANDVRALLSEAQPRTDAPTTLHDPAPPARQESEARPTRALASDPVPESGNLPGFLSIMLKTDLELSGTATEREAALTRHAAVTTRGEARSYIAGVMARVRVAQTAVAR